MKSLDVKYNGQNVGKLSQDESGKMSFQYNSEWLSNGFAISMSLPLQRESFSEQKCRPFFEGLLPEDAIREEIARNLGVSSRSDFALLREIGGDCAGAISVGDSRKASSDKYEELIEGDRLLESLQPLTGKPLFAGEKDVRLSIAGSQRKLPIIYKNGHFYIPHGDIPTTAIIKPEIQGIDGSIENEFFCLTLAQKIGIPVPEFEMLKLNRKYLVIKRYDRAEKNGNVVRLHQEDLCQAMGIPSENKYQKDGGPSFKDLFAIIRKHSSQPALDIRNAVRIVVFNYVIGNADAHGKNFSFLIEKDTVKLAPFYDLLSTAVYPNLSQKMAMKIGNKYEPNDVFKRHWQAFAEDISVKSEFVEKEIKYVSTAMKKWAEAVANDSFSLHERPDAINRILRVIADNLEKLNG
ncbi:MAG: type II toxin-antitoxin system HipA family toxin [Alphaproteobacteria bacterium]|nr:type II toxin-antitoxin system HipA family toxin [Alphaproteobacteria bacterium]